MDNTNTWLNPECQWHVWADTGPYGTFVRELNFVFGVTSRTEVTLRGYLQRSKESHLHTLTLSLMSSQNLASAIYREYAKPYSFGTNDKSILSPTKIIRHEIMIEPSDFKCDQVIHEMQDWAESQFLSELELLVRRANIEEGRR